MRRAPLVLATLLLLTVPPGAEARRGRAHAKSTTARILLAGAWAEVRWTDGDTFRVLSGPHEGRSARLVGVNALESFGPVHRWGGLPATFYLSIAKKSAAIAAAASVRCDADGRPDGYGRLLVVCPEVAEALVRAGHAMVFAVDGPPDPRLVALQRDAQRLGTGMWAGGAPPLVPTSLHSADEPDLGARGAYDRLADTRTGVTTVRPHHRVYRPCEEVCVGEPPPEPRSAGQWRSGDKGVERACMTYVPFARRYRDRPACLRGRP